MTRFSTLTSPSPFIVGLVTGPMGKKVAVRFLVDSGATYTLLPKPDWEQIGLQAKRTELFAMADGTNQTRTSGLTSGTGRTQAKVVK